MHVNRARLWTLPDTVPDLVGPAVTPQTAARHAAWADGLSRSTSPGRRCRRCSTRTGRPAAADRPACRSTSAGQPTDDEALAIAHDQWRSNVFAPPACWDVETVETFDVIGEDVSPEQVRKSVHVSSDLGKHAAWLQEYVEQGWDELYLHFVGQTAGAIHRRIRRTRAAPAVSDGTQAASRRSHEKCRHRRPVVEERRLLLRGHRDVLRLRTATAPATSAA